ncbi:hypothetical protein M440DRAFT_20555 [Trichoderma longibrachiatum ATCC 18648]|uniref:Uncharacterized protein n=1 Tax=Trichoderma longibrachiatum ATCC 18648 TaxID=983965 RepID=A0A2T4C1R0_TRILO|nr:hypothetical protein M440DRAFT_20555 [Trichoderma longibrachiatum ATCC 18648]
MSVADVMLQVQASNTSPVPCVPAVFTPSPTPNRQFTSFIRVRDRGASVQRYNPRRAKELARAIATKKSNRTATSVESDFMCVGPVRGKWSGTGPGTGCEWRLALLHTHDEVYTRDCAAQTLEVSRQLLPHTLGFQSPSEGSMCTGIELSPLMRHEGAVSLVIVPILSSQHADWNECHRPHFAHVLAQSTAASLDARYTKQTQHRRHSMKVIGMRAYPPKGTHPFSVAHVPQNGEHGKRMKRAQTAPVVSLRLGPATSPF